MWTLQLRLALIQSARQMTKTLQRAARDRAWVSALQARCGVFSAHGKTHRGTASEAEAVRCNSPVQVYVLIIIPYSDRENSTVFVGDLPAGVEDEELRALFKDVSVNSNSSAALVTADREDVVRCHSRGQDHAAAQFLGCNRRILGTSE